MGDLQLHENVLKVEQRVWQWNGITVVDVHEHTRGEVVHPLVNMNETGLAIALEEVGGPTEPRLKPDQACAVEHRPNHMAVIPKGMELWGHASKDLHFSRYGVLLFDVEKLESRFGEEFTARAFDNPRLRYVNPKIHALVNMLVQIPEGKSSSSLLGDSLTAAAFAILSARDGFASKTGKLENAQVRRVTDYLREQMPRQVELRELADLVGQSQSHFSRAFKATTGFSPYQWQLEERISLVRHLLLRTNEPLAVVAARTGFSDAMHMSKMFKARTGQTPGAWRNEREV